MENQTQTKKEQSLEQKEIRGITFRLVYLILASTVVMVATLLGTYYNLKSSIKDANTANAIQDYKLDEMRIRLDKLDMEVKELKEERKSPQNQ